MTNKIEKQFFDTFGIEPNKKEESELVAIGKNIRGLKRVEKHFYDYPQITDHILLELFDILRKYYNLDFWTIDNSLVMDVRDKSASYTNILYRTGGDLKPSILSGLQLIVNQKLNYNEKIKQQVRTLFEEG